MGQAGVREYCRLDDSGKSLLRAAMSQLGMSARAFHRILKLARTIADPSIGSGQAWRVRRISRRIVWRRRYSTGRDDKHEICISLRLWLALGHATVTEQMIHADKSGRGKIWEWR